MQPSRPLTSQVASVTCEAPRCEVDFERPVHPRDVEKRERSGRAERSGVAHPYSEQPELKVKREQQREREAAEVVSVAYK